MISLRQVWRRLAATRYTRALEAEVERLRAENRALLNSILGIAGVPPLPAAVADLASATGGASEASEARGGQGSERAVRPGVGSKVGSNVAVPLRRRSWQQVTRLLEFESAQKDKASGDGVGNGRLHGAL